jgi:HEPN domain-containing protein
MDWLRHAQSDLAIAAVRKSRRMLYEHQCFHAQQAAEKAVKAILVASGLSVPRSHDLAFLLAQLPREIALPVALVELPLLTKYAVQLRYPGETEPVTSVDRRMALRLAQAAVEWAEQQLTSR